MRRVPFVTCSIVALSAVIQLLGLSGTLELDTARVTRGEVWLLLTGHLAHFSWSHFFWDAVAVLILGALVEPRHRGTVVAVSLATALSISLPVVAGLSGVSTYRGLSGIATALFVVAAILKWREWPWVVRIAVAGAGLKTVYEAITAQAVFVPASAGDMLPLPMAHAVGLVIGALLGCRAARAIRARPSAP